MHTCTHIPLELRTLFPSGCGSAPNSCHSISARSTMMDPPPWKPPSRGGPSPASSSSSSAPRTTSSVTLPPISAIYNLTSADTASAPDHTANTNANTTFPPHDHNSAHPSYGLSDQASFNTWITPANSVELAEADDDDGGGDYDDDTNFVFEHGRRYHANADGRVLYPLPNDESEQERDDMKHKLALWMMHEKLFYAPVEEALKRGGMVIDLGTGTGEWAMEMARGYGESQIYGCDISPIQPDYVWDNVFFSVGDFEEDWADYPENAFDYIHMRYTAFAIKDPVVLLQRAMKHLKPGGYLEFQEMTYWPQSDDATLNPSTPYAFRDFCYYQQQGLANLGLDLHMINRLPGLMRAHNFDDVTEVRHKLPIGRWPRDRRQRQKGIWFARMILMEGLSAICKRPLCLGLGWQAVQVEMFLVDVRKSLNDASVHSYFPFTVVYGRKPLEGSGHGASSSSAGTPGRP